MAWQMDMGATATADGVRFRVWAPTAGSVEVELEGQQPPVPLAPEQGGVWSGVVREATVGSRYRYRLNGELSRPDPYSRSQPEGPHGPSEVVNPGAFRWTDAGWTGVTIQGLVIYQVHVGTATQEGTFDALIDELPRMQRLGVNAIQLLPVAEFPGTRNWGYDGVDLFAVAHVYGGPAGLKRLVDAAHQVQLGVIIDAVYNHFGPDGNYLRDFAADYFTHRHQTPWGDAINYDGPNSTWTRKMVVDNACYWLHEYHADGLRLDATHAIFDDSPRHLLAELTTSVRASLAPERNVVLIAETGENDVGYLKPVEDGGFGLDAVYADDFHHILRRFLAGDHEGYYADYAGTLDELARCIQQGWLYEGQSTPRTGKPRGTPARKQPAWQFLYALQNHDQIGNRAFGDRLHQQIGVERFAAASALLLFLPYTPMLFMGQEFAASSPFQYFTDHTPELGNLVTAGRRKEFEAFSAFADPSSRERIPDPQAESTFMNSKLRSDEAQRTPGCELEAWYRELLRLRHTDPVLRDQARERMSVRVLGPDALSIKRWSTSGQERLLVVNFGKAPLAVEAGGWEVLIGRLDGSHVPGETAVILGRGGT